MLQIIVPISPEGWDEEKQEFVEPKVQVLRLEHSLVSISKWESKWCKSFIHTKEKTYEETLDYIKCMTLSKDVKDEVYTYLTQSNIDAISDYINAPMTASTITDTNNGKKSREIVTSELIYYWMIASNIPFECQKWHLNRLLMLIRICSAKNNPSDTPMSRNDILSRNKALNAARKKKLNTRG